MPGTSFVDDDFLRDRSSSERPILAGGVDLVPDGGAARRHDVEGEPGTWIRWPPLVRAPLGIVLQKN